MKNGSFTKTSELKLGFGRQSKTTSKLVLVIGALAMLVAVPLLNLYSLLTTLNFQTSFTEDKATVVSAPAADATKAKGSTDTATSGRCLDLDLNQEMDSLVASAHQVVVTMPAKAGGSSMNHFNRQCS
jgi:hypothetical protein